ncbi:unnamed protein product, partial [Prorocentrum cordatum]
KAHDCPLDRGTHVLKQQKATDHFSMVSPVSSPMPTPLAEPTVYNGDVNLCFPSTGGTSVVAHTPQVTPTNEEDARIGAPLSPFTPGPDGSSGKSPFSPATPGIGRYTPGSELLSPASHAASPVSQIYTPADVDPEDREASPAYEPFSQTLPSPASPV